MKLYIDSNFALKQNKEDVAPLDENTATIIKRYLLDLMDYAPLEVINEHWKKKFDPNTFIDVDMHEVIAPLVVQGSIGTSTQHEFIVSYMEQYFDRWPSYRSKLTDLEWYHLYLDAYEAIEEYLGKKGGEIVPKTI